MSAQKKSKSALLVFVSLFLSSFITASQASKLEKSALDYVEKDLIPVPLPPSKRAITPVEVYLEYSDKLKREYSDPAKAAEKEGKLVDACAFYEREVVAWQVFEDKEYTSEPLIYCLVDLMRLYLKDGRDSDAEKIPERLKFFVDSKQVIRSRLSVGLYRLSECCLEAGRFVIAEKVIRELIATQANFGEAEFNSQLLLVRALLGQGKADEARKLAEQLALQAIKERRAKCVTRARMVLDEVYRKGRIENSPDDLVMKLHLRKCPLCSTTTALLPISYGLKAITPETLAASDVTVHYGGCCIEPYRWYCKNCKQEF